jgi:hypothetical protein
MRNKRNVQRKLKNLMNQNLQRTQTFNPSVRTEVGSFGHVNHVCVAFTFAV